MDTIALLLAACKAANLSQADAVALLSAIGRHALQSAQHQDETPNSNICDHCRHDSRQPANECICACHDIFVVILGTPANAGDHR